MFAYKLTRMVSEQSSLANIRPSDRVLVILICSDQILSPLVSLAEGTPNRDMCKNAENTLASRGFAVTAEWQPDVADSGAGAMQISTVASVVLHQDGGTRNRETLARDGIELMCAIDAHKVASASTTSSTPKAATSSTLLGHLSRCDPRHDHCDEGLYCSWLRIPYECHYVTTSATPTTATSSTPLGHLSRCDPRHDRCDEKEGFYCDPKVYECRYVELPVRTTATPRPGLDAVDTTTTSASTVARATSTISRLKPTATTPATPATPGKTRKSHTLKEFMYWCFGGLVAGAVVGIMIMFRRMRPTVQRRGEIGNAVGGGDAGVAYRNRAFQEHAELQDAINNYNMSDDTGTDDHTDHYTTDEEFLNETGDEARLLDFDHNADNAMYDSDTIEPVRPNLGYHAHRHSR